MNALKSSQTFLNLAKAFANESQAHMRYSFVAYGAHQAKLTALEDVIKKIATNEYNHARMYYTYIQSADGKTIENIDIQAGYPFKEKWDILENLGFGIENETEENSVIYPQFAQVAHDEGFEDVALLFERIAAVELCHTKLLTDLHQQMSTNTMYKKPNEVKWKCGDCGYEATAKNAWETCPLCEAPQGAVMLQLQDQ